VLSCSSLDFFLSLSLVFFSLSVKKRIGCKQEKERVLFRDWLIMKKKEKKETTLTYIYTHIHSSEEREKDT
jgi:hypothetical protein